MVEVIREKIGQLGSDLHASFLQKFPGGESGKVFNLICLLAFSECVCIVHLICLNLCVQAGPTSNLLDESELLTGWEVLAIKNRMREVQARKASARATKASAVV